MSYHLRISLRVLSDIFKLPDFSLTVFIPFSLLLICKSDHLPTFGSFLAIRTSSLSDIARSASDEGISFHWSLRLPRPLRGLAVTKKGCHCKRSEEISSLPLRRLYLETPSDIEPLAVTHFSVIARSVSDEAISKPLALRRDPFGASSPSQ